MPCCAVGVLPAVPKNTSLLVYCSPHVSMGLWHVQKGRGRTGVRSILCHVQALSYGVSPTMCQHRDIVCHLPYSSTGLWCVSHYVPSWAYHIQTLSYGVTSPTVCTGMVCHLPCSGRGVWCLPYHVPALGYVP